MNYLLYIKHNKFFDERGIFLLSLFTRGYIIYSIISHSCDKRKKKKKNKLRYSHIFSQFILTYLGGRKK